MKPEAQRIAIAEACGWRVENQASAKTDAFPFYLINASGVRSGGWRTYEGAWSHGIPDYLTDLNAMHEAEKSVIYPRSLAMVYLSRLQDVANTLSPARFDDTARTLYCSSATAAQRAEAFLRTIGRWEEDK